MRVFRSLATMIVLALAGVVWTGGALASPGEITTYPVRPCSDLLPVPEGVLVQPCDGPQSSAEPVVVNLPPDGSLPLRTTPAQPSELIAAGPSGELWFSLRADRGYLGVEALDRVGADGTVHTFVVPAAPPGDAAYVHGLVLDGEGTGWAGIGYEENNGFNPGSTEGGRLLRLSPGGAIESFQLPFQLDPQGLALGPEGSIWFTAIRDRRLAEHLYDPGTGFIGRLDHLGKLALFRVPAKGGEPAAITVGPGGKLWFTESVKSAVESIAPDGTFGRRYPLSLGYPNQSLAFGPEGNLWTEGLGGVERVTPWGQETVFPGRSEGVVIGGDGDVWSAESEDVERILPGAPGVDVHRLAGRMSLGAISATLACGGSPSACEGTLDVELRTPPLYRQRHKGEADAGLYRLAQVPYSVSAKALALIALFRHSEVREGVPLVARATVEGGPSLRQELRATLGTRPETR